MPVEIHDSMWFYTGVSAEDVFSSFIIPGTIVQYQDATSGDKYHNNIYLSHIAPTDEDDFTSEDDTSINIDQGYPYHGTDYEYHVSMWDKYKLLSEHPLASRNWGPGADKNSGDRVIGVPVLAEHRDPLKDVILQIAHPETVSIKVYGYNVATREVTITIASSYDAEIGDAYTLAAEVHDPHTISEKVSNGSLVRVMTLLNRVEEWDARVVSRNGNQITLYLKEEPEDTSLVSDAKYMAPTNQHLYVLPLGQSASGTDSYDVNSQSEFNVPGFSYIPISVQELGKAYDRDNNANSLTTKPTRTISQKILLNPTLGGVIPAITGTPYYKMFVIVEREQGIYSSDNGFKIIPTILNEGILSDPIFTVER